MYIPIMKNRKEELNVIQNMSDFFNKSMIPLIEVIKDEYKDRFKIDRVTGDFIYEIKVGKKRKSKIKLPHTEEDIITLSNIQNRLKGKVAFIDFFRFSEDEYDNKAFKGIELSFRLSRDFDYYRERILKVGEYSNLIPVISIKKGFSISEHDLIKLFNDLRKNNPSIAIRITDYFLDNYIDLLEENLAAEDYLMLDIRNQNMDSKFIELEEFRDLITPAQKILLNSPRSRILKNGDYENLKFTNKIDNKVAKKYKEYNLDGFGDFGGLKDDLPVEGGGNGLGAALGLIYSKKENAFFSIVNEDTSEGMRGFKYVRSEVLRRVHLFDNENKCRTINRIKNMNGKFGNWGTWTNLTLTRYIQQQSESK